MGDPARPAEGIAPRRLDRRLMLPVFLVVCLDAASSGAVLPILPFFLRDLGATPLVLGIVLGAEALSQFAAAPWLGQLSDRFGRRTVLLASQAGALLSLSLLASAEIVAFALLARVLLGLTAANFPMAAAYAADNSSPADRRRAIGILSAGLGLGGMVGPGLSGLLSDISLTAPIWLALALSAASMLVTGLWLRGAPGQPGAEAIRERVPVRSLLASPAVRILVAVLLCHYFSYGMFSSQLAMFLGDTFVWNGHAFGPAELSCLLTANGAINIAVQLLLLPWLGRRLGERSLIVLVFCILATGYVAAGAATGIGALAFAILCVSTGEALARPTFVAALSIHVTPQRQGVAMGAIQSLVAVTDIASPVLAGLVVGQGFYAAWIGMVAAIALAGAAVARSRLGPAPRRSFNSAS